MTRASQTAGCVLAALLVLATPGLAQPQSGPHDAHHPAAASRGPASLPFVEGEVRRIDRDARKITLRHGPIANLDMPGMTMVFRAAGAGIPDDLKTGDKVRFKADRVDGELTVTEIEIAN